MSIPTKIKQLANDVRTKIYGRDVRESIAKGMEESGNIADNAERTSKEIWDKWSRVNREWDSNPDKDPELTLARGNHDHLEDRLNLNDIVVDGMFYHFKKHGVIADGYADDTVAFQACADYCLENNLQMVGHGTVKLTAAVNIQCDADLSRVSIEWHGSDDYVIQIGKESSNTRENGTFKIGKMRDSVGYWRNNVAIKVNNINRWNIDIADIKSFGVGVLMTAKNYGTAYNTITVRSLINNKINFEILATKTGWVNENLIIGGSYSHTTDNGMLLPDVHNLKIHMTEDSNHLPDNNVFIKPSLEGSVPEIPVYILGQSNVILNGRYESHKGYKFKVKFGSIGTQRAVHNVLEKGYGLERVEVIDEGYSNVLTANNKGRFVSNTAETATRLQNKFAGYSPCLEILAPESNYYGDEWSVQASANRTDYKSRLDEFPRIRLNHALGTIQLGNGRSSDYRSIRRDAEGVKADGIGTEHSTWDQKNLTIGQYHFWVAANGKLRMKLGKPTSDTDGYEV